MKYTRRAIGLPAAGRYDESGNRVRKCVWKYVGSEPDPVFEGDNPSWELQVNEFYVRDASGKDIALYNSGGLVQWNMWGLDQVGHMNADTTKYYYLKDHLGSTRAVINSQNQVISAQDYDVWGYTVQDRTYNNNSKYKYTGKERDNESNYDYFGARYYDSRIANWLSVDPLFEKHISWTPYNYVLRGPLKFIDPEGKQVNIINNPIYNMVVNSLVNAHIESEMKTQMIEDIKSNTLGVNEIIGKYGAMGQEYVGGNLQPTNIEFDLALFAFPLFSIESKTSTATSEVSRILENPYSLMGREPGEIKQLFQNESNWILTGLGKGSSTPLKSEGFVLRELTSTGEKSGTIIQYHPGLGRHGLFPYWKFSSPATGTIRMGTDFIFEKSAKQLPIKALSATTLKF